MAKATAEIMVEGKNINDMQWTALQKHIVDMTQTLLLERGERTKSRKECDIIRTFWQNTEKEFEEANALLLKKYLQVNVLWDEYKGPCEEIEQEITFQKFMVNFDAQYNEKDKQKRIEVVGAKWDQEVLPKMMDLKTKEALRFDKKQDELNNEYKEAQKEYEKIIEDAVKKSEDRILDWVVTLYERTFARKKYLDLQFLLKKFFCCEQKNLLIHDLKAAQKANFEKIRSFIRERIEGDLMQIISLSQSIDKLNKEFQTTSENIGHYKVIVEQKETELKDLNKIVKLCELKLNSYKQNIDTASRSNRRIEKLNKDKAVYDERRKQLEDEVRARQKEKNLYLNLFENVKQDVKKLQKQYFGDVFEAALEDHMQNLTEFDNLFDDFKNENPELVKKSKEQFFSAKREIQQLPLLVTREIKGHNDFIESAMAKLSLIGVPHVPQFVHVTSSSFPTGSGPGGLTCI